MLTFESFIYKNCFTHPSMFETFPNHHAFAIQFESGYYIFLVECDVRLLPNILVVLLCTLKHDYSVHNTSHKHFLEK